MEQELWTDEYGDEYWTDDLILISKTGSRFICDPPPRDTDEDHVLLVEDLATYGQHLLDNGWNVTIDVEGYDCDRQEAPFITGRKGNINLIIYSDVLGYARFVSATLLAKDCNILDKQERVELFRDYCEGLMK